MHIVGEKYLTIASQDSKKTKIGCYVRDVINFAYLTQMMLIRCAVCVNPPLRVWKLIAEVMPSFCETAGQLAVVRHCWLDSPTSAAVVSLLCFVLWL